jgi:hypothetical protein
MNSQWDSVLLLLQIVALPMVLGLGGAMLGGALHRQRPGLGLAFGVALLLLGFMCGYAALNFQQWSLLPQQAMDWLPLLAVLSACALVPAEWRGAPEPVWLALQSALAAAGVWVLLPPAVTEQGVAHAAVYVSMLGAPWVVLWRLLERFGGRYAGMLIIAAGAALGVAVTLAGSIVIGGCALCLAAALAGWEAAAWLIRGALPLPRAALGSIVAMLGSTALAAVFYAEYAPWLANGMRSVAAAIL